MRERTRAAIHPEQAQMQEWLMKARDESREGLAATNGQSDRSAWRAISISIFCSQHKQAARSSICTDELGRIFAYAGGWYEQLRTVQVYAIVGLIAALIFAFMGKESQRPRLG